MLTCYFIFQKTFYGTIHSHFSARGRPRAENGRDSVQFFKRKIK